MFSRRASLLCALLLTAGLICILPKLLLPLAQPDSNRMDEHLRPIRTQTLTVWVLSDGVGDRKLLSELCATFEQQNPSLRVFVRRVPASELEAENAVAPDIVLYSTGDVVNPEQLFAPLAQVERVPVGALVAGKSSGQSYAVPLWFAPGVLAMPNEWFANAERIIATPRADSFFDLVTPAPDIVTEAQKSFVSPEELPWKNLLAKGALKPSQGVALQQLLFVCPKTIQEELVAAMTGTGDAQASAVLAKAGSITPTPAVSAARILSLAAYQQAIRAGEKLMPCPLMLAVSEEVRYLSLPKNSDSARVFVQFLLSNEAQQAALSAALLPVVPLDTLPAADLADPLTSELLTLYLGGLLFPNAFSHTREELHSLCMDAFLRNINPVETLLRLR